MESAITWPWLRRIQVQFTNLKGGVSRTIEADGTQNTLHITAEIQKDIRTIGMVSSLNIWNLSPDSRSSFIRDETQVRILAGWDKGPMAGLNQVFYGNVLFSEVQRNGPDIVSKLHIQAGRRSTVTTTIAKSWRQGIPIAMVVENIARAIPGIGVDPVLIQGITGSVGESGLPIFTDAETALNQLGRAYGFYWIIDDGRFSTVSRDPRKRGASISSAGTIEHPYLIAASPIVTGIRRVQTGIEGRCMFNSLLRPGHSVTVKSVLSSQANGEWRLSKIQHSLSTHNGEFTTHFSGLRRR